jgi:hypothetical protein
LRRLGQKVNKDRARAAENSETAVRRHASKVYEATSEAADACERRIPNRSDRVRAGGNGGGKARPPEKITVRPYYGGPSLGALRARLLNGRPFLIGHALLCRYFSQPL